MSLVLNLPPELEAELTTEAKQLGLNLTEYALQLLSGGRNSHAPAPRTGAELLAYWESEGLVGIRPEITDAPGHVRALREQAQRRARP